MSGELAAWIESVLGPHTAANRLAKGDKTVLEVVDRSGRRWFGKAVQQAATWSAEVRAYREWAPSLSGRAPTLHAADRARRMLLLSAVPGKRPPDFDIEAHREAGRVLRLLHELGPTRTGGPHPAEHASRRLEAMLDKLSDLLSVDEMRFARERIREIASLPSRPRVPCHGDYKPHNWLRDDHGVVRIIDFGNARWQVPAFDLTRLGLGPWWGRPHLVSTFLDGYGRTLDEDERQFLRLHLVSNAVNAIRYGATQGSTDRETFGRERLQQLMRGDLLDFEESVRKGSVRRLRTAVKSARSRAASRQG